MKIGFFGGSFNPPTIAHYNLIKQALIQYNFDEVYFVPVNNYYGKANLISIEKRIEMLKLLCEKDTNIGVLEIEKDIKHKLNTIDILNLIEQKYINDDIIFFMGEDNYIKMSNWKDYDKLQQYNYIVFQRNDKTSLKIEKNNVLYMKNSENLHISSTQIRNKLKKKEDITSLVSQKVFEYIKTNKLYID